MYAKCNDYRIQLAEGHVADSIDKPEEDTPHLRHGCHFLRLAHDILVWSKDNSGAYQIRLGADRAYDDLGQFWLGLSPDNAWGGSWGDYGHFSRRWRGVA
jgi:hypothetical protein